MNTLHLTLKKKWFDMIASGEKKEEYREIKPYWVSRLHPINKNSGVTNTDSFRHYDQIYFRNGYSKNADFIILECKGIDIGKAKPEWSDNFQGTVFIIKLGQILNPTK